MLWRPAEERDREASLWRCSSPPSHWALNSLRQTLYSSFSHSISAFCIFFSTQSFSLKDTRNKICMPSVALGVHVCGEIPAAQLLIEKPLRQQCRQHSEKKIKNKKNHHRITKRGLYEKDSHLYPAGDFWMRITLAGSCWNRYTAPWQLWEYWLVSWGLPFNISDVWSRGHCPSFHPILAVDAHTEGECGESAFLLLAVRRNDAHSQFWNWSLQWAGAAPFCWLAVGGNILSNIPLKWAKNAFAVMG